MRGFDFDGHRNEMNRMHRQVRGQVAVIQIIALLVMVAIVTAGAWLLLHPESVGSFFGRIAAGFGSAQHRG